MPLSGPGILSLGSRKPGLTIFKTSSFNPTSITGLSAWFKADAGLLDASDAPITVDATAIKTWQDQSGNGNHATQATAGNRPVAKLAIVNGKPVVRFANASSQFLTLTNSLAALTAGTGFVVVKAPVDPGSGTSGTLWTMGTDTLNADFYPFSDGKIYEGFGSTARKTTVDPTPALTSWHVYEVSSAASAWTNYLDGAQLFTTATNTVAFPAAPKFGKGTDGSHFFGGDIAEFLLYNSALSAGNRSSVRAYLGTKYGITVS